MIVYKQVVDSNIMDTTLLKVPTFLLHFQSKLIILIKLSLKFDSH